MEDRLRPLEESIAQQLQGTFGIYAGKKDAVQIEGEARMSHLSVEDQQYRRDLLDHLEHIKARGFKPKDSLDQLIREIAFTHLNRLCAYKMMEAREVYVGGQKFREAVSRGINSNGFKFYLADHPDDERLFNTGDQETAYRHFLDWLGGLLSEEVGVLFSPNDPANRLYPRQKTMDDLLALLNGEDIKPEDTHIREAWPTIWEQDETIGWVYQYFTPRELIDQARKNSQAPRNSYELSFRNQFYTPRYVVEFLTDNTLGRIWYEMRKGDTTLKDQCDYMVRRPNEIFLDDGNATAETPESHDPLSQEELLQQPVHVAHRPKKDPRELKILDPACGSGHFLLYCFDLLLTIYEESYSDPELGPALREEYATLDDLRRDTPRLILARNLHGIDIDLRASQIAALALWLRCQRAYQELALKKDRPKITRSNIVCAEPMPGEIEMRAELKGTLRPAILGQLVDYIFDQLRLAGEVGSLLRIDQELQGVIAKAKTQWLSGPREEQLSLFEMRDEKSSQQKQFDLSGITDEEFWDETEATVLNALREYGAKASNGKTLQRRLFADDAANGFALIDLCQQTFDTILMNPPFGDYSSSASTFAKEQYPRTKNDIYGGFIECAYSRLNPRSLLGAITPRTWLTLTRFEELRKFVLSSFAMPLCIDLGYNVLDSMAEVAMYVMTNESPSSFSLFMNLFSVEAKQKSVQGAIDSTNDGSAIPFSARHLRDFHHLPTSIFGYDVPPAVLRVFQCERPLEESTGFRVKQGMATGDNERFLRLHSEVPQVRPEKSWPTYGKGGEFAMFESDLSLVVDWRHDGIEIKERAAREYGSETRTVKNQATYFRSGLTFSLVSQAGFSVRVLPKGCIYDMGGPSIFPHTPSGNWSALSLLAFLNSTAIQHVLQFITDSRHWHVITLQSVPVPDLDAESHETLRECSLEAIGIAAAVSASEEGTRHFVCPFLTLPAGRSLTELLRDHESFAESAKRRLQQVMLKIDDIVCPCYGVSPESLSKLRSERVDRAKGALLSSPVFTKTDFAAAVISWCVGASAGVWDVRFEDYLSSDHHVSDPFEPLSNIPPGTLGEVSNRMPNDYPLVIDWDGILPEDDGHRDDIVRKVRDVVEVIWDERADTIEKEACEILSVKSLRDYFRKPGKGGFWNDHIARYSKSRRKAPIYWLLQSAKKNYALWLYYHRLDKDMLFKALLNYVEPKIQREDNRLSELRSQKSADDSGKAAKKLDGDIEKQEDLIAELRDFEEKLRKVAELHLVPDLNDGVVLNIAPLHELVPWKEAKKYWNELMDGKYEWSSIGKQLREKGLVKG